MTDMNSYAVLLLAAGFVDDTERNRIANENRVRSLEEIDPTLSAPYIPMLNGLIELEKHATKQLERTMKAHPYGPWVMRNKGVGLKQGARMLAAIGDPGYNYAAERPRRGPAELWAYCGYRPGQRRRKGVQSNWNSEAKMRVYLVAKQCVMTMDSPFRQFYDAAREKYTDAVHDTPCPQCTLKGKPSPVGSPLRDGHVHARAIRHVAKTILIDLYEESQMLQTQGAA
jgi:hypothetical protein